MHDDLAHAPVDIEIQQHQLLDTVEVPVVVGYGLVVPLQLTSGQVDCQDRTRVQIVDILRATELLHPRLGVARADVDEIGIGIVSETIPHGPTAAILVELAAPGLRGSAHRLVLVRLRWIARDRVEAPCKMTSLRIHGHELATRGLIATGRADDHLAAGDARRHR